MSFQAQISWLDRIWSLCNFFGLENPSIRYIRIWNITLPLTYNKEVHFTPTFNLYSTKIFQCETFSLHITCIAYHVLQMFNAYLGKPSLDCCPDELTVRQNQTAKEGQSISLYCSAAGYPKPKYQWVFENKTVSSSSVFTISNVFRRNEGVYSCMVQNSLGEVTLILYLNVLGKFCRVFRAWKRIF